MATANDDDSNTREYVYEEFKHLSEMMALIEEAPESALVLNTRERAEEKFKFICDSYQEQPHLLDPHLESILNRCIVFVRDPSTPPDVLHMIFRFMFLLVKTRGYKSVIRLMPHEVADLEATLKLLSQQDPTNTETWETSYVLLLWLSIVCMIPFDLCRLDVPGRASVQSRVMDVAKGYLNHSGKPQEAAAYLLAKFLCRPDVVKSSMADSIAWFCQKISKLTVVATSDVLYINGLLRCMSHIFKLGKRQDLLPFANTVLSAVKNSDVTSATHVQVKKLLSKLLQRIGLIFLPMRIVAWRYQRGNRSLLQNLAPKHQDHITNNVKGDAPMDVTEEEEDIEVPDEIAEIIDHLLKALKDRDTVVRWSAAKGIGRLSSRLPHELVDGDVVSPDALLGLFTRLEGHASWHGGCLALAELARRGLLLPERLPDVLPLLLDALVYEERTGDCSLGSNVRDAACYVCWAFARAYDPREMADHVVSLASSLVLVSLFDREVNVRRAAAAAFQENVGRQGHFPHGIDILVHLDYFAVGNRVACYVEHSEYIAQFREYVQPMIDHLVDNKVGHWDATMREMAAKALNQLTKHKRDYMLHQALPRMLAMCTGSELYRRHGAILAAAEVLLALNNPSELKLEIEVQIKDITVQLAEKQMFRGMSGELMRRACCNLIDRCSRISLPVHQRDFGSMLLANWSELLEECLQHREVPVQDSAIEALPSFLSAYYNVETAAQKETINKYIEELLERFLNAMESASMEHVRSGMCRAVGCLPSFLLSSPQRVTTLMRALINCTNVDSRTSKWAGARSQALTAMVELHQKSQTPVDVELFIASTDAMLASMQDYTVDSRGDVGAVVREASMNSLVEVCYFLINNKDEKVTNEIFTPEKVERMICGILQQAVEKIDRTRGVAGENFARLLHGERQRVANIPHLEQLLDVFPKEVCAQLSWSKPMETFHLFCRLLPLPQYQRHLLLGLTVSVGGLTESTVRYSSESVQTALNEIEEEGSEAMDRVYDNLVELYTQYEKQDRIIIPLMKFFDFLLNNTSLADHLHSVDPDKIIRLLLLTKAEIARTNDVLKIMAAIEVFCSLLQFPDVRKRALSSLMLLLCHRFPVIRKTSATKLYESLLTYEGVVEDEDSMDETMTLLTETIWEEPVDSIRDYRNRLCTLLNVAVPVIKGPAKNSTSNDTRTS